MLANNKDMALRIPVPPTPGPKSVSNIQADAKSRFAGIIWLAKDPNVPLEHYFHEYDFWSPYSEDTVYSKRPYIAIHNSVPREYQNYLCIIEEGDREIYYVVGKRVYNENDVFGEWCPCICCRWRGYHPARLFTNKYQCGCLKTGAFAQKEYLELAKVNKNKPFNPSGICLPLFTIIIGLWYGS